MVKPPASATRRSANVPSRRSADRSKPKPAAAERDAEQPPAAFPIVGIGASAGGLEAFTQLLTHLPTDTNMAFVLVQHLDPKHESHLTELISRVTKMPVSEVTEGMPVAPNHVFVIPPNTNMAVLHGSLHLMPRAESHGLHLPIDYFLRSLAEDQLGKAIGVILSGTASDGVLGLKAIKAEGGITFAQDERSAKYDGMPHSAITAGVVDIVLPPEGIAVELARLGRHPYLNYARAAKTDEVLSEGQDDLNKLFILMRTATGVDFSYYKHTTIKRRIKRRMALHQIEPLAHYVTYLRENPAEVRALYDDILISVTSFFRDPEAFEGLKTSVFPNLLKQQSRGTPIRVWVPGCSTGEEAYSIAICLIEFLNDLASDTLFQIFATDISNVALERARIGIYSEAIALDITPERLKRFFVKVDRGYQISKTIRDTCVFARQNLVKDPPFSKLDLISCRNVLIYLGSVLQKKIIPLFHFALKPDGFLMLGTSETIGAFSDLFASVDRKNKVYSKKSALAPLSVDFAASKYPIEQGDTDKRMNEDVWSALNLQKEADRIVMEKYGPAGVVINDAMGILHFRGYTGRYLEPPPGEPSFNILKMAREGLRLELRHAIEEARKGVPVRKDGLLVKSSDHLRHVNLEVIPLKTPPAQERSYLVLFEDVTPPAIETGEAAANQTQQSEEDPQLVRLQLELTATREYLQSVIEEQEATTEELQSASEEIQSSNEELQSTNEELETAKEELNATNEELTTVNQELQNRNLELSLINNDLMNLLRSINIPIVMLDRDLRIRRFTPPARQTLNLIPTDVGRPISDLKLNMDIPNLEHLIREVLDTLNIKELEAQDNEGRWYATRIHPYRTTENKIDGVLITLVDIDVFKRGMEQLKTARDYADAIAETIREPLLILDEDLHVRAANRAFYRTFQVSPAETEDRLIYDLGNGQWNIPELRALLEQILPGHTEFHDFVVEHTFPTIGPKRMLLNVRRIDQENSRTPSIILAIEDVTGRESQSEGAL
jgi:two-component system CheB/CheR fusion protein